MKYSRLKNALFFHPHFSLFFYISLLFFSCRGQKSEDPPIHPNLNMDFQARFIPQKPNPFFADGRSMRPLVAGTVPRGFLREDKSIYEGQVNGKYTDKIPLRVDLKFLERGQERYNIHCEPCHGGTGAANGIVIKKGMLLPSSFHAPRIVDMPVGQLYEVITKGVRGNMPSYSWAITVEDRWAIVSYVRALQKSQMASLRDIPRDVAVQKGWTK